MVPLLENPLEPGTMIDRYRIVSRLAIGGMAELYLADAKGIEGFEKRVVLKRIHPVHLGKPDYVGMFLDEARITATIHHPNVAQVYDIGCDGDIYFFTMEHVDGRDVRHIYNRVHRRGGRVPLDHTINICVGALAGLHAAHEMRGPDGISLGIVHRDVSPSNVIVTWGGNIKLIDFGIAKAARRQTMTRNGAVKGKHCSMSPEQACGKPIDRRSDIFSLGIMLWEMSVGETLFVAENEYDVMRMIVDGEVDRPTDRLPDYPRQLEAIVMRALAQRPEDRYQTAEEMLIALDEFARQQRLVIAPYALARYLRELFADRAAHDSREPVSPPLFLLEGDDEIQLSDGGGSLDATLDHPLPDEDTGEATIARVSGEPEPEPEPEPAPEPDPVGEPEVDPELQLEHMTLPVRRARDNQRASIPPVARGPGRGRIVVAGGVAVALTAAVLLLSLGTSSDEAPAPAATTPVEPAAADPGPVEPAPEPAPVEPTPAPVTATTADEPVEGTGDEDILSLDEGNGEPERAGTKRPERKAERREARARRRSERKKTKPAPAPAPAPEPEPASEPESAAEPKSEPEPGEAPVPDWAVEEPAEGED